MPDYELGVIGAGNMAEAILYGVIQSRILPADRVVASEPRTDRRMSLASALGIDLVDDNALAARQPRLLLAVKPQMMAEVLDGIAGDVRDDALVVSIAAGVTTKFLAARLGGRGRIVRVMPNTPMLVGQGASALAAGPGATADDLEWARGLFAASGLAVVLEEESQLDAVTAVSGSGPAYVFYLVEAMVEAGVAEGLSQEMALALARQTVLGAGKLMVESQEDPAELRRKVTSPGGTTQRAIETMDAAGVKDKLINAIRAAARRSRELGT